MVDTILGWGEGAIDPATTGKKYHDMSLVGLRVAERVWDSLARIDRQRSKLSTQAEQWRTLATSLNVNAALNRDPKIRSAMFRIADRYDLMARSAEISYKRYLRKSRHLPIERREFVSIRRETTQSDYRKTQLNHGKN